MDKNNPENIRSVQKKDQKKEFLSGQNECYLCGQPLSTHIEYLPQTHLVVERAQCHSCMTVVRVKNHSLH